MKFEINNEWDAFPGNGQSKSKVQKSKWISKIVEKNFARKSKCECGNAMAKTPVHVGIFIFACLIHE